MSDVTVLHSRDLDMYTPALLSTIEEFSLEYPVKVAGFTDVRAGDYPRVNHDLADSVVGSNVFLISEDIVTRRSPRIALEVARMAGINVVMFDENYELVKSEVQ